MHLSHREVEQLERQFRQNGYNGDILSPSYFTYKEGRIPVLISAPHSTNHLSMVDGSVKVADVYTGTLALLLHNQTKAHVIHLTKQDGKNPNGEPSNSYKDTIDSLHKQHGFRLIIDLHGAVLHHPFDIDLGTSNGLSMSESDIREIKHIFSTYGILRATENHTFSALYPTITHHAHSILNIPSVQLEINRRLRNPSENFFAFQLLTEALSEIIQHFNQK